jgi:YVTN family beta-propeller protein
MQHRNRRLIWLVGALLGYAVLVLGSSVVSGAIASQSIEVIGPAAALNHPTYSSPIAISADNALVWVVNPDDDLVSVIRASDNKLIKKINVGDEPQSIAVDPTKNFVYVANAADNTISVIRHNNNPSAFALVGSVTTLKTGAEPWDVVISPDGNRVFVANSGQDTISVIDANTRAIIADVNLRTSLCNDVDNNGSPDPDYHFQPRGLAVTVPDGSGNARLYVTRFLSFVKAGGAQASDSGKEGLVCRLNVNTSSPNINGYVPTAAIRLAPRPSGFPPGVNELAYPNQLQSIVIRDGRAYLPNIAASPAAPVFKFNADTQAFVNRIDNIGGAESDGGAINLHLGARNPEVINNVPKTKLFFANPWAIAFKSQQGASYAYAVSAGSDLLVKLKVDASGVLSFTVDADTTRYIDLNDPSDPRTSGPNAGKNPLGIVINDAGTRAYVMNYVSRNVSVVDLNSDSVQAVIKNTDLPPPGTLDEIIQVGKEMFFSSRGHFDRPPGTTVSTDNRLSSEGWQNCASCHFNGLTDGNIWAFNSGPRKSVPLNGTFNPHNPDDQRLLNYSAIFDEVQDFEANIRNVSGPNGLDIQGKPQAPCDAPPAGKPATSNFDPNHGLLIGDNGDINLAPCVVNNLAKPNAGRPQHTVTLPAAPGEARDPIAALDALKEWVRFGVRTPNGQLTTQELASAGNNPSGGNGGIAQADVDAGRRLFLRAGCQSCHGGGKWTNSTVDFAPPPPADRVAQEAPATDPNIVSISYINDVLRDIKSFNLGVAGASPPNPIGANIGAPERSADNKAALGKDHNGDQKGDGFNPPSLLGIWALPPYYHNGACETLACVLSDNNHRRAGLGGRPDLSTSERAQLVAFLKSLDADTDPATNLYIDRHDIFFDPPAVVAGSTVTVGANVSLFGAKTTFNPPLVVRFYDGLPGAPGTSVIGDATLSSFDQDFGQKTVTVQWNVPNQVGRRTVFVAVDFGNQFPEDNENDNTAARRVSVRRAPSDTTLPQVVDGSVKISDDVPFNGNDAIATSRNVRINFRAIDAGNNLDSFCIVRYAYDPIRRRWVEENCSFRQLPSPNSDGSFTVNAELRPVEGVGYAFIWVKDRAGNISRQPGFDFISFIPLGQPIQLDRNDIRIFRVRDAGAPITLRFGPLSGDVDVSLFDGNGTRINGPPLSGTQAEEVTIPGSGFFQVEVRAVRNSRFTITQTLAGLLEFIGPTVGPAAAAPGAPLVSGPPALQAAIDGSPDVFLPLTIR